MCALELLADEIKDEEKDKLFFLFSLTPSKQAELEGSTSSFDTSRVLYKLGMDNELTTYEKSMAMIGRGAA